MTVVTEFLKYNFTKVVDDNAEEFPSVAQIPDGMLKKVDSSNSVLQAYLKKIDPSVETRILLSRIEEGPSKCSRRSKKVEESPTKLSQEKK